MCLECDIARYYGECLCWPLLPGSTFALRIGTRERYKIQVSAFEIHVNVEVYENLNAFQTCDFLEREGERESECLKIPRLMGSFEKRNF